MAFKDRERGGYRNCSLWPGPLRFMTDLRLEDVTQQLKVNKGSSICH